MSDEPGKQQNTSTGAGSGSKAPAPAASPPAGSAASKSIVTSTVTSTKDNKTSPAAPTKPAATSGAATKAAAAPAKGAAAPAKGAAAPAKGAAAPAKGAAAPAKGAAPGAKGAAGAGTQVAVSSTKGPLVPQAKGPVVPGAQEGKGTTGSEPNKNKRLYLPQRNSEIEQRMKTTIADFISKCGVPRDHVTYGDFSTMNASVVCRMIWRFKAKHVDNAITRASGDAEFMDKQSLSEFTAKTSHELEHDDEACRDFIALLRGRSMKELIFLTKKINVLRVQRAMGVGNCTVCEGSGNATCRICRGAGSVSCPSCGGSGESCALCRGTGLIMCEACKGRGKQLCPACNGVGTQVLERYIRLEAQGSFMMDFYVTSPISESREYIKLDPHEQDLVLENCKLTQSHEERTPNAYQLQFKGQSRCCRLYFDLKGCPEKMCYTVCGDALTPIAKPFILDYVFQKELTMISRILATHASRNDLNAKIALCKAISSKAILAKTFANLDNACMHILRGAAHKNGIPLNNLTNDKLIDHDPKIHAVYNRAKPDMIKRIAAVLKSFAQGFVSEDFAQNMAGKLLAIMPVLEKMNPKSKKIWSSTALSLWLFVALIMALLPYKSTAVFCVLLAAVISALTSFYATKNLTYFGAVQSLKVVRHGKIIPDLMPEAVETMKLMGVTLVIVVFMLFFWA